jgi:tetratricopeptide (TPR) repeat protein
VLQLVILSFMFLSCDSTSNDKRRQNKSESSSAHAIVNKNKAVRTQGDIGDDSLTVSKQTFYKAIDLQRKNGIFLSTPKDTLVFIKSAQLMEKAISLDSCNLFIYINLAKLYFRLDSTEKSIQILDNLLDVDSNYVEAVTAQGFIYEKIEKKEKATNKYKKALDLYSLRVNKEYQDYVNKAFLILLLYGQDSALIELQEVKRECPNKDVSFFENQFRSFDRDKIITNSLR